MDSYRPRNDEYSRRASGYGYREPDDERRYRSERQVYDLRADERDGSRYEPSRPYRGPDDEERVYSRPRRMPDPRPYAYETSRYGEDSFALRGGTRSYGGDRAGRYSYEPRDRLPEYRMSSREPRRDARFEYQNTLATGRGEDTAERHSGVQRGRTRSPRRQPDPQTKAKSSTKQKDPPNDRYIPGSIKQAMLAGEREPETTFQQEWLQRHERRRQLEKGEVSPQKVWERQYLADFQQKQAAVQEPQSKALSASVDAAVKEPQARAAPSSEHIANKSTPDDEPSTRPGSGGVVNNGGNNDSERAVSDHGDKEDQLEDERGLGAPEMAHELALPGVEAAISIGYTNAGCRSWTSGVSGASSKLAFDLREISLHTSLCPNVHYCTNAFSSEKIARLFLEDKWLGFDIEYKVGQAQNAGEGVSVLQLASEHDVAVFHLSQMMGNDGRPLIAPTLRRILECPAILKIGNAIKGDCTRVSKWFGVDVGPTFELMGASKVLSPAGQKHGLADQFQRLFNRVLDKGEVRVSDWMQPLTAEQQAYAANDAFASLLIFHGWEKVGPRANDKQFTPMAQLVDSMLSSPSAPLTFGTSRGAAQWPLYVWTSFVCGLLGTGSVCSQCSLGFADLAGLLKHQQSGLCYGEKLPPADKFNYSFPYRWFSELCEPTRVPDAMGLQLQGHRALQATFKSPWATDGEDWLICLDRYSDAGPPDDKFFDNMRRTAGYFLHRHRSCRVAMVFSVEHTPSRWSPARPTWSEDREVLTSQGFKSKERFPLIHAMYLTEEWVDALQRHPKERPLVCVNGGDGFTCHVSRMVKLLDEVRQFDMEVKFHRSDGVAKQTILPKVADSIRDQLGQNYTVLFDSKVLVQQEKGAISDDLAAAFLDYCKRKQDMKDVGIGTFRHNYG